MGAWNGDDAIQEHDGSEAPQPCDPPWVVALLHNTGIINVLFSGWIQGEPVIGSFALLTTDCTPEQEVMFASNCALARPLTS